MAQRLRQAANVLMGRGGRAARPPNNIRQYVTRVSKRLKKLETGYGKELKTLDTVNEGTRSTTGQILPLTAMSQGDTSLTREGLQIRPRHLQYKIVNTIHANDTACTTRYIIFSDKEMQGTYPTPAQLMEGDHIASWPEHDTRPRFRIHKVITISHSINGNRRQTRNGIIKFSANHKIWFSGTNAAEASLGKNHLFLYVVSDEQTNSPQGNFYTRLRFTE